MSSGSESLNHHFIAELAEKLAGRDLKGLDFGCGTGFFVSLALERGLDFHGCDTYDGIWTTWIESVPAPIRPMIHAIEAGKLPFADASFDIVTSNQVFEHIPEPFIGPILREIARVLKPGGIFVALFPTRDIWFEGHLGVYFVHRMRRGSRLRQAYLSAMHALGAGYYRDGKARDVWVREMLSILDGSVCYHPMQRIEAEWSKAFGAPPTGEEAAFVRHRLARHSWARPFASGPLATVLAPLYRFICRIRAGRVIVSRKG